MRVFGIVLGAALLLAPAAHARDWFTEDVQNATCNQLPYEGVSDPADAAEQLRQQGAVPQIQQNNGSDGQLVSVVVSFPGMNNSEVAIMFFTSMEACQNQLSQDIKNGSVVDPNSLK